MAGIHITDIEAAINWWRDRSPSPDGITACGEVRALAEVYALMVYYRESLCDEATMPARAKAAWLDWYDTMPDAPCIAICSTSQGDAVCKGCGRTFEEVQHWTSMTPGDKRAVWRRIAMDGTAWRFNRYAERARGAHDATAGTATAAPLEAAPGGVADRGASPAPAPAIPAGPAAPATPTVAAASSTSAAAAAAASPDAPSAARRPRRAPSPRPRS